MCMCYIFEILMLCRFDFKHLKMVLLAMKFLEGVLFHKNWVKLLVPWECPASCMMWVTMRDKIKMTRPSLMTLSRRDTLDWHRGPCRGLPSEKRSQTFSLMLLHLTSGSCPLQPQKHNLTSSTFLFLFQVFFLGRLALFIWLIIASVWQGLSHKKYHDQENTCSIIEHHFC